MATLHGDKLAVLQRVGEVLELEIHGDLMDFYATAVALTETQPDQVNNEVRNAIAHLGRALALDSRAEAEEQIRLALGHVNRAKRDAIKLAVLELHDRIQSACSEIKHVNGTIDSAFMARRDELTKKRKHVLREEINGSDHVMQLFVELFNEADQLEADLISTFNLVSANTPPWRRYFHDLKRNFFTILIGLLIGIIATLICCVLVPDGLSFGNNIREAVGLPKVPTSPVVNNSPKPVKPDVPAPP